MSTYIMIEQVKDQKLGWATTYLDFQPVKIALSVARGLRSNHKGGVFYALPDEPLFSNSVAFHWAGANNTEARVIFGKLKHSQEETEAALLAYHA